MAPLLCVFGTDSRSSPVPCHTSEGLLIRPTSTHLQLYQGLGANITFGFQPFTSTADRHSATGTSQTVLSCYPNVLGNAQGIQRRSRVEFPAIRSAKDASTLVWACRMYSTNPTFFESPSESKYWEKCMEGSYSVLEIDTSVSKVPPGSTMC